MLDALLRRHTASVLGPIAARLAGWRVRAGALTLSTFLCLAVAMLDIGHRDYLAALVLLVIARVFDMLDGPVARRAGETAFGAWLDQALDPLATAGLAFAFALAQPDRALAAMFLMLGLVARAATRATLLGKTELFVAFAAACLFPPWFSIIAYATGVLCFVAAGSRVASAATGRT